MLKTENIIILNLTGEPSRPIGPGLVECLRDLSESINLWCFVIFIILKVCYCIIEIKSDCILFVQCVGEETSSESRTTFVLCGFVDQLAECEKRFERCHIFV